MSAFKVWRVPSDAEIAHGMAELAAIVGEAESVRPSWTRRLVIVEGERWALLVEDCAAQTPHTALWDDKTALEVFRFAYPLSEGVAILQGPANPEKVMEQRLAEIATHDKEVCEQKAADAAARLAKQAETERLAEERRRFNGDGWDKLPDWRKFALTLAIQVEARDPALANDLRSLGHQRCLDFPRARWES